jgi:hypothetical protein
MEWCTLLRPIGRSRVRRGRRELKNPCARAGLFAPIARPYLAHSRHRRPEARAQSNRRSPGRLRAQGVLKRRHHPAADRSPRQPPGARPIRCAGRQRSARRCRCEGIAAHPVPPRSAPRRAAAARSAPAKMDLRYCPGASWAVSRLLGRCFVVTRSASIACAASAGLSRPSLTRIASNSRSCSVN